MKILLLGENGSLGRQFTKLFKKKKIKFKAENKKKKKVKWLKKKAEMKKEKVALTKNSNEKVFKKKNLIMIRMSIPMILL